MRVWSILFLAAALGAQERERVFGLVRAADGEPWVGARVELRSRPVAHLAVGAADAIVVTSDSRGRFRAEILPWRSYTVWAREKVGDSYRLTRTVERVVAHTPVVLEEREPRTRATIAVDGLDAWQHRAPFRYAIAPLAEHAAAHEGDLAGDEVPVPPIAGDRFWLELFGAGGYPIHRAQLGHDDLPERWSVPAPVEVALDMEVPDTFPGGVFVAAWRGASHHIADVDRAGHARVEIAAGVEPWALQVRASGFAPAYPEWIEKDGGAAAVGGRMVGGSVVTGRLLIRRGVPAAGWSIWIRTGMYLIGQAAHRVGTSDVIVTTDRAGRFVTPPIYDPAMWVVLSADDRERWPRAWRRGVAPLAWLGPLEPIGEGEVDLGDVDLQATLWLADLQLRDSSGVPAPGGRLVFEPGARSTAGESEVWTDRNGKARALLPKGDLAVIGRHGDEWAVRHVRATGEVSGGVPWEVRLDPARYVRGRLLDDARSPIEGQRLRMWLDHSKSAEVLSRPPAHVTYRAFTIAPIERFQGNRLQNLVIGELHRQVVLSGADGRFGFSVPNVGCTFALGPQIDGRVDSPLEFAFEGETVDDLVLRR